MREIKFRAWDGEQMYEPFTLEMGLLMTETALRLNPPGWLFSVKNTYMQFTGLKDKNGKEVYEGDILKKLYGAAYPYIIVSWHEERMAFINNDGYNQLLFEFPQQYCEIVGNIYETPQLLNSEQNPERSVASKADSSNVAGQQTEAGNKTS